MRDDQRQALQTRRDQLAQALQALNVEPEGEGSAERVQRLYEALQAQRMLERIDAMLAPTDAAGSGSTAERVLATIPKGRSGELRVTVREWPGRSPTVELRAYGLKGTTTMQPTSKGVQFEIGKLPEVIAALQRALVYGR